jgi:CcmD family protein
MEHFAFLCAAYSIIFAVIFLYLILLGRRQRRIEEQISTTEAQLKEVREKLSAP